MQSSSSLMKFTIRNNRGLLANDLRFCLRIANASKLAKNIFVFYCAQSSN